MESLQDPSCAFTELIEQRPVNNRGIELVGKLFYCRRFLLRSVSAVLQQMVMQVDLYGTGLRAGAAKRTGMREMLPILQAAQVRCDDRANWPRIGGAVSVSADVAKDGANVQASAATNTMEGITLLGISEQRCSLVIQ